MVAATGRRPSNHRHSRGRNHSPCHYCHMCSRVPILPSQAEPSEM